MSEHRWAAAVVVELDEDQARALAAMDADERARRVHELVPALPEGQVLGGPKAVRGPMCEDCRVHWREVYAQPDKPWPCPGKRPERLGGPLLPPDKRLTRQQRRAQRRKDTKAAVRQPEPAVPYSPTRR